MKNRFNFPFITLSIEEDDDLSKRQLDLCIPLKDGEVKWLKVDPKPKNMVAFPFTGKSETDGYVEADKYPDGYFFTSYDEQCYRWVANLKPGKAQRIASEIASRNSHFGY